MSLSEIKHWVFDMDGTLTIAVHDFAAIREALSIPPEDDILTHLAALPADESAAKHAWLLEHERDLALGSRRRRARWSWCGNWPGAVIAWASSRAMPGSWPT